MVRYVVGEDWIDGFAAYVWMILCITCYGLCCDFLSFGWIGCVWSCVSAYCVVIVCGDD